MTNTHIYSLFLALLAAILFGMSAPLSKVLLGNIDPIVLAALLYLGSGVGLLIIKIFQTVAKPIESTEAKLAKSDLKWLAGATLAGGVIAPIILLYSLDATPAATASLLLNFESVATTIIAALIFKEAVSRRAWWAILFITLASILLSINLDSTWGFSLGALGIIAASLFWGIDNNLTRNISAKDPTTIVTIKGFVAGTFSLVLAMIVGQKFPAWETIIKALAVGSLSYGLSITLFIMALRSLGSARTSALFSTAPLSGLVLSFIIYKQSPGLLFLLAFPIMILGTIFLATEDHEHIHSHEIVSHEHAHNHQDGHHEHAHIKVFMNAQSHSHLHEHKQVDHGHHHMPDTHHRHAHIIKTG